MNLDRFDHIDFAGAQARIAEATTRTPLVAHATADDRIDLRLKLENRQSIGAFKARGAINSIAKLSPEQRAAGVIATSSGNHGKALSWAAARSGVKATIVMPANAYPNKIQACRDEGADVELYDDRATADEYVEEQAAAGRTLIHPFDADNTIEGAGTVGIEIAEGWPEVELVVVPIGGGGLVSGIALALNRTLGDSVCVLGAEPEGAASMAESLRAGEPVSVMVTTEVQGLSPPRVGDRNMAICAELLAGVELLSDEEIYAAQRELVGAGETVEPAGSAAVAAIREGRLEPWLAKRTADDPLRVVAVVSGGNPAPEQLAAIKDSLT